MGCGASGRYLSWLRYAQYEIKTLLMLVFLTGYELKIVFAQKPLWVLVVAKYQSLGVRFVDLIDLIPTI